jgi:hypothetical protein
MKLNLIFLTKYILNFKTMFTKIQKSSYYKHVAILSAFSLLTLSFTTANGKIILRAGTPVLLETTQMIMSNNLSIGQSVDFRVRYDVKSESKSLIKAGSIAKGQVTRVQKARGLGKEGYVEIQIKSVQAADGQMVPLTGGNIYREGEDQQVLAWGLGLLVCILFLMVKGKNAQIAAGTSVDANVAMDVEVVVE